MVDGKRARVRVRAVADLRRNVAPNKQDPDRNKPVGNEGARSPEQKISPNRSGKQSIDEDQVLGDGNSHVG